MKALYILAILLLAVSAQAAEVTLAWDNPNQPTWGTRIYIGTEAGVYLYSHDAGVNTQETTIKNLEPGKTYYIAARHYVSGMQSGLSNEVAAAVPSEIDILPPLPEIDNSVQTYQITIRKVE